MHGFTLIELMLVVLMIGILVTVVVVTMADSRKKATYSSFMTVMNSTLAAAASCVNDNGTLSGGASGAYICNPPGSATTSAVWPAMPQGCHAATGFSVASPGDDAWSVSKVCVSGGCQAVCTAQRCVFTGCQ